MVNRWKKDEMLKKIRDLYTRRIKISLENSNYFGWNYAELVFLRIIKKMAFFQ